jgi:DNA-binding NarL/FixJ family response regulator
MDNLIRIVIIDDEPVIREGLGKIISFEHDMTVVGQFDGTEALDKTLVLGPDLILLDIIMPGVNGFRLIPIIKEKLPNTKILMLSVSENEDDILSAFRMGAHGYLTKFAPVSQIIDGIRRTSSGEAVLSPNMIFKLVSDIRVKSGVLRLSNREMQVLELIREGMTNQQMAERLIVEQSTIKTHVSHLLGKLCVKNRAELVSPVGYYRAKSVF